ncbi:MAG: hypothetical protein WB622_13670 [Acidobacteriaceae bacterium]
MRRNFRYGAVAAVLGMIPVGVVLYEFYLAPASAQGGVVIAPRLWYVLCAFTPVLPSLLSSFERHHRPEGFAFALLLILSNVLIYGLCGFLIAFLMKKAGRDDRIADPQPRTSH